MLSPAFRVFWDPGKALLRAQWSLAFIPPVAVVWMGPGEKLLVGRSLTSWRTLELCRTPHINAGETTIWCYNCQEMFSAVDCHRPFPLRILLECSLQPTATKTVWTSKFVFCSFIRVWPLLWALLKQSSSISMNSSCPLLPYDSDHALLWSKQPKKFLLK